MHPQAENLSINMAISKKVGDSNIVDSDKIVILEATYPSSGHSQFGGRIGQMNWNDNGGRKGG